MTPQIPSAIKLPDWARAKARAVLTRYNEIGQTVDGPNSTYLIKCIAQALAEAHARGRAEERKRRGSKFVIVVTEEEITKHAGEWSKIILAEEHK